MIEEHICEIGLERFNPYKNHGSRICPDCRDRLFSILVENGYAEHTIMSKFNKFIDIVKENGWEALEAIKKSKTGRPRRDASIITPVHEIEKKTVEGDPISHYMQLFNDWRVITVEANERKAAIDNDADTQKKGIERSVLGAKEKLDNYVASNASVLTPFLESVMKPIIDHAEIQEQRIADRENHAVMEDRAKEARKEMVDAQ